MKKMYIHALDNLTPSLIVTSSGTEHEPLTDNGGLIRIIIRIFYISSSTLQLPFSLLHLQHAIFPISLLCSFL